MVELQGIGEVISEGKLDYELLRLRKEWRSNGAILFKKTGRLQNGHLSDGSLIRLDEIIRHETGYDLDRLGREFLFRFSGVVAMRAGPNEPPEWYILTEQTEFQPGKKYSLPGGKIKPEDLPFTMLQFARFWSKNHSLFERVLAVPDSDIAPLLKILVRGNSGELNLVRSLEEQMSNLDRAFNDSFCDVRLEGYREFWEEFGLLKLSNSKGDEKPVYIRGARPIGIFLDPYRAVAPSDQKKLFVSFNYQMDVIAPSSDALKEQILKGAKEGGEVGSIRWASLLELAVPGTSWLYQSNVPFAVSRMIDNNLLHLGSQRDLLFPGDNTPKSEDVYVVGRLQQPTVSPEKSVAVEGERTNAPKATTSAATSLSGYQHSSRHGFFL